MIFWIAILSTFACFSGLKVILVGYVGIILAIFTIVLLFGSLINFVGKIAETNRAQPDYDAFCRFHKIDNIAHGGGPNDPK